MDQTQKDYLSSRGVPQVRQPDAPRNVQELSDRQDQVSDFINLVNDTLEIPDDDIPVVALPDPPKNRYIDKQRQRMDRERLRDKGNPDFFDDDPPVAAEARPVQQPQPGGDRGQSHHGSRSVLNYEDGIKVQADTWPGRAADELELLDALGMGLDDQGEPFAKVFPGGGDTCELDDVPSGTTASKTPVSERLKRLHERWGEDENGVSLLAALGEGLAEQAEAARNEYSWITPAGAVEKVGEDTHAYYAFEHLLDINDPNIRDTPHEYEPELLEQALAAGYIRVVDEHDELALQLTSQADPAAINKMLELVRQAVAVGKPVSIDKDGTYQEIKNKIELGRVTRFLRLAEPVATTAAKKKYTREEAAEYLAQDATIAKYIKGMSIDAIGPLTEEQTKKAIISALQEKSGASDMFYEVVLGFIDEDAESLTSADFPELVLRMVEVFVYEVEQVSDLYNTKSDYDLWRAMTITDVPANIKSLQDQGTTVGYPGVGEYWASVPEHAEAHWASRGHGEELVILHGRVPASAIDWERTLFARINNDDEWELYVPAGTPIELLELLTEDNQAYPINRTVKASADDEQHQQALEETGFWGRQGAGSIIMARDTGRVLLPRRSDDVEQPGTWGVWGGAIDEGEDPQAAAQREVSEEAGYGGDIEMRPLAVYTKGDFKYHNFLAIVDEEFEPSLNWETADAQWFDFGDWPSPLHFGLSYLLSQSAASIRQAIKKSKTAAKVSDRLLQAAKGVDYDTFLNKTDGLHESILYRGQADGPLESNTFMTDYIGHAREYGDTVEAIVYDEQDVLYFNDSEFNSLRSEFSDLTKKDLKSIYSSALSSGKLMDAMTDGYSSGSQVINFVYKFIHSDSSYSTAAQIKSNDLLIPIMQHYAKGKGKNILSFLGGDYGDYGGQNEFVVADPSRYTTLRSIWNQANAEGAKPKKKSAKELLASVSSFQEAVEARLPAGGTVTFEEYSGPDYLEMADIQADNPGHGWGSRAMQVIVDEADKRGVSLMLLPVGEPGTPKHERLAEFYQQYGFEDAGDGVYHRRRSGKKQAATTIPVGTRVEVKNKDSMDYRNWGIVKHFDGEYYHVAMNNGTDILPIFERNELKVVKIQEAAVNTQAKNSNMTVVLEAVPNPDFGRDNQRGQVRVPRQQLAVRDLADAQQKVRQFIKDHDLGGGNLKTSDVYDGDELVATISYNGRLWDPQGKEILASRKQATPKAQYQVSEVDAGLWEVLNKGGGTGIFIYDDGAAVAEEPATSFSVHFGELAGASSQEGPSYSSFDQAYRAATSKSASRKTAAPTYVVVRENPDGDDLFGEYATPEQAERGREESYKNLREEWDDTTTKLVIKKLSASQKTAADGEYVVLGTPPGTMLPEVKILANSPEDAQRIKLEQSVGHPKTWQWRVIKNLGYIKGSHKKSALARSVISGTIKEVYDPLKDSTGVDVLATESAAFRNASLKVKGDVDLLTDPQTRPQAVAATGQTLAFANDQQAGDMFEEHRQSLDRERRRTDAYTKGYAVISTGDDYADDLLHEIFDMYVDLFMDDPDNARDYLLSEKENFATIMRGHDAAQEDLDRQLAVLDDARRTFWNIYYTGKTGGVVGPGSSADYWQEVSHYALGRGYSPSRLQQLATWLGEAYDRRSTATAQDEADAEWTADIKKVQEFEALYPAAKTGGAKTASVSLGITFSKNDSGSLYLRGPEDRGQYPEQPAILESRNAKELEDYINTRFPSAVDVYQLPMGDRAQYVGPTRNKSILYLVLNYGNRSYIKIYGIDDEGVDKKPRAASLRRPITSAKPEDLKGFVTNIEDDTKENELFRKVLYTGENSQLVLMSLKPGEDIGEETHEDVDQFFRIDGGTGEVVINGKTHKLENGSAFVIPAGAKHNVINTSKDEDLKLYSVYAPPNHADGTVHDTKDQAEADKEHFDGQTTE